jgi:hypothetical protein
MRVIASTIAARRTSTVVADWIRGCQQELSDAVHAVGDKRARDHGWEVTNGTGRLGFGARIYWDPRFGDQRPVPAEANTLGGAEGPIRLRPRAIRLRLPRVGTGRLCPATDVSRHRRPPRR